MFVRSFTLVALLAATPAFAQIQTLPETSRSEGQANSLNNSLTNQSQGRTMQQQNQFEVNSLRNSQAITPPVVVAPIAPPTMTSPIR